MICTGPATGPQGTTSGVGVLPSFPQRRLQEKAPPVSFRIASGAQKFPAVKGPVYST